MNYILLLCFRCFGWFGLVCFVQFGILGLVGFIWVLKGSDFKFEGKLFENQPLTNGKILTHLKKEHFLAQKLTELEYF